VRVLRSTLGSFQVFAISFAFISVAVGIFGTYDDVLQSAGPVGIWLWVLVAVGQLLVALVFAQFAARIPLSGSSYQWASRLANPKIGWGFGWLTVCYLAIAVVAAENALANTALLRGKCGRIGDLPCVAEVRDRCHHAALMRIGDVVATKSPPVVNSAPTRTARRENSSTTLRGAPTVRLDCQTTPEDGIEGEEVGYLQLSFTRPVPEQWQGLSEDQWNAKLADIFAVVDRNGGSVKVTAVSPSHMATISVIEYPDDAAAIRAVAGVQALGTLQFDSVHHIWDLAEYRGLLVEGQSG
jgi:hypothetical protein